MRLRTLPTLLQVASISALAGATHAEAQLYGLSSSSPGTVYTLNTATGAATSLVSLAGNDSTSFTGLEFLNGTLYATDVSVSGTYRFGSIDLGTGTFAPINSQNGSQNWQALAADPNTNLFYTVDQDAVGNPLLSITPGGTVTTIGPTNQQVRGLAYDSNHSVLYGVSEDALYTISAATGAATFVGSLGLDSILMGLAYDPGTDTLYLNTGDDGGSAINTLYTVNFTTGAASPVGPNGVIDGNGIDSLAFLSRSRVATVPEPSALTGLIGCGLTFMVCFRKRR